MNHQELNNQDDGELSDNSVISDAPPPPPRPPRRREPTEHRTIILRNKEIIRQLMRLGASTGKTIIVLSATGRISYAELTPRASLEPVTVIRGPHQIDAIFGRIDPPFQNAVRDASFLVTLSGIAIGASRGIRLVSHGDVEVKIQLRRILEAPALQVPVQRTYRKITVNTNRDISEWFASESLQSGRTIRVTSGTGKISDATIYSYARKERLTNVGHADILQLTGVFHPNGTGTLLVTLSGVSGGTAKAYRLTVMEMWWLR